MVIIGSKCFIDMMYQKGIDTNACSKLYYLASFSNHRFPYGKLYEDIKIVCEIVGECQRIAVVDNIDYYYYQRYDSIQYQNYTEQKMFAVESAKYMVEYISEKNKEAEAASIARYFNILCNIFFQIRDKEFYRENYMYIWDEIKKTRMAVLCNGKARIKSRLAAILSFLGPELFKIVYVATQKRGAGIKKA